MNWNNILQIDIEKNFHQMNYLCVGYQHLEVYISHWLPFSLSLQRKRKNTHEYGQHVHACDAKDLFCLLLLTNRWTIPIITSNGSMDHKIQNFQWNLVMIQKKSFFVYFNHAIFLLWYFFTCLKFKRYRFRWRGLCLFILSVSLSKFMRPKIIITEIQTK